jgi:hypothetical protein
VYTSIGIVTHGYNIYNAIYINSLVLLAIMLILVMAWMFSIILQHYFDVEIPCGQGGQPPALVPQIVFHYMMKESLEQTKMEVGLKAT